MTGSSTGEQSEARDKRRGWVIGSAVAAMIGALAVAGCSGGGGGGGQGQGGSANGGGGGDADCGGFGNTAPQQLFASDVTRIVAQAANEAAGRGVVATITVVDRVGNILAVARTPVGSGQQFATITSAPRTLPGPFIAAPPFSLENAGAPFISGELASIAKAITGAYLSSNGNAFSTRTASFIVQENFPPQVPDLVPSGPLFGVQFSQLPCSPPTDIIRVHTPAAVSPGPHRSPLGLSADAGGIPLYKSGNLVGAIGVSADGVYGLDRNPNDFDSDVDEIIALAGTSGYSAPDCITANRITVGFSLRYVDATPANFVRPVSASGTFDLVPVPGYYDGAAIRDGTIYGTVASGFAIDGSAGEGVQLPEVNAVALYDAGARRFAPRPATDTAAVGAANVLTTEEVRRLLTEALKVAFRGRAGIRRPLGSFIQVTVSVVDTNGEVLGVSRTPDAPIFGTDVSLQKARSAMVFSLTGARADFPASLQNLYIDPTARFLALPVGSFPRSDVAVAETTIGNLSRPFFPDGINNNANTKAVGTPEFAAVGPLSLPFNGSPAWSPFGDGLQFDISAPDILAALGGAAPPVTGCGTGIGLAASPGPSGTTRLSNGLQIFSGGVPLYRRTATGPVLVGGIGVSGDGITQDNMISFLGANNAGNVLGTGVGNAPREIRADRLQPPTGGQLLYVQCPQSPFLDSDEQLPCSDK
jgi:uncharacterized protein GlcG (DUF336 family)